MLSKEIEHGKTYGPQPSEADIRHLPQKGFATVIDLRPENVEGIGISPEEERRIAKEVGLRYVHEPIDWDQMTDDQADRFRTLLKDAHGPVYVHSVGGKGAAVLLIADHAIKKRQNAKEAVRTAEALGAIKAGSRVETFLAHYVSSRVGDEEV